MERAQITRQTATLWAALAGLALLAVATLSAARPLHGTVQIVPLQSDVVLVVHEGGVPSAAPAAEDAVARRLEALSIEQKLGQMVMFGFDGIDGAGAISALVHTRHVGNTFVLDRNVGTPAQVSALTARLHEAARQANGVEMLIGIDQEGGSVQRLRPPTFPGLPSARELARAADPARARQLAAATARELRGLGLTVNFAPVLDVNDTPANPVIGARAYGSDPATVTSFGLAVMHGLSDGGVIAAVKHFPGHGSTTQDSHLTLPTVPKTDAALRRTELPPFVAAVEQNAAMVMTAHVRYPAWDAAVPATLSPRIIQGLLRDELRYDGVVITDDLAMRAVSDRFPAGEAAVRSVEAGCDLLLLSGPAAAQHATLDALRAAIESGRLSESRIDESVTRILRLKHRYDIMIEDR